MSPVLSSSSSSDRRDARNGHTEWQQSSEDLEHLKLAKESIEQAAKFLNEAKRRAEAQRQLMQVAQLIKKYPDAQNLQHPDRELKRQGIILASEKEDGSAYVYLFLFNDILLVTKPKRTRQQYRWKFTFHLSSTRLEDVPDTIGTYSWMPLLDADALMQI